MEEGRSSKVTKNVKGLNKGRQTENTKLNLKFQVQVRSGLGHSIANSSLFPTSMYLQWHF